MAKKGKEDPVPTIHSVQNRDIIQRLNYMYQAGAFLQGLHAQGGSTSPLPSGETSKGLASSEAQKDGSGKRPSKAGAFKTMGDLGRSYVHSMKVVGQRTTVKMDPSIKRAICRGCDVALVPGVTVSTRIEKLSSHGHVVVYTCTNCKSKRRIPAPPIASPVSFIPQAPAALDISPITGDIAVEKLQNATPRSGGQKRLRRKKKGPLPRQPLLAGRKDAGHVIFRGSEKLVEEDT